MGKNSRSPTKDGAAPSNVVRVGISAAKEPQQENTGKKARGVLQTIRKNDSDSSQLEFGATYKVNSAKDRCGVCGIIVKAKDEGLMCDMCEIWFHGSCGQIDSDQYKLITKLEGVVDWFCDECKNGIKNLHSENKELKEANSLLRKQNDLLQENLLRFGARFEEVAAGLNEKIEKIANRKSENSSVNEGVMEEITNNVLQRLQEEEDKKKRKNNLVIYGLPEQGTTTDVENCAKIFEQELGEVGVGVVEVCRLGKTSNEERLANPRAAARPLLVRLSNADSKFAILKKAKLMKNTKIDQFKKIIIAPDLSLKEREEDKKLRDELKEKLNNGERGWFIKKKKLCQRENFQSP